MKQLILVIALLFISNVAYAKATTNPSETLLATSIMRESPEYMEFTDFIDYYNDRKFTDVKKEEKFKEIVDILGDRKLRAEDTEIINLTESMGSYSLLIAIRGKHEDLSILCAYDSRPPQYVINLNKHDAITVMGKYNKLWLDIIFLTECDIIIQEPK